MKHIISACLVLAGIVCIEHRPLAAIVCIGLAVVISNVKASHPT